MIRANVCKENHIHILGRSYLKGGVLTLFWTASGIELEISASELWIEVISDYSTMEPWISIEINDSLVSRQMVTKGIHNICIFRNMTPNVKKHVRILRETQAMSDDNDNLLQIRALYHDGTIEPMPQRPKKIEFIGDSITSGEGTYGSQCESDWVSMFFSASNNYAVITADALNADFDIISQSGWGVSTSWDGDPQKALPLYYEQICGVVNGKRNKELHANNQYDFRGRSTDLVVVNLGTNDEAALRLEDGGHDVDGVRNFKASVIDFLRMLRRCNPCAEIIWAYGMLGTVFLDHIKDAVTEYKRCSKDEKVSVLELPQMNEKTMGACGHPGAENHMAAAAVLIEYIGGLNNGI